MGRRSRPRSVGKTERVVAAAVAGSRTEPTLPPETSAATTSRDLLGRFFAFLPDFFLDLAAPFAREPWSQEPIEQIREKKNGRHPFVIQDRENENKDDGEKTRDRFFRSPVDRLEAGILELAEHHEGQKEEQRREKESPIAQPMFAFGQPEQEKCDRRDETGRGGNRKPGEIFRSVAAPFALVIRGGGIETGHAQCAARQVNEREQPAGARELLEHDAINHQRRR